MMELLKRCRRIWSDRTFRRTAIVALLGGAVFVLTAGVGAWTRACANDACPSIQGLTGYDPDQASKVYAADGRLITDFGLTRRTVLPIAEMAPAVPAAFVAVEDKRFYQHHGVDWIRFFGVIKHTLLHGNLQQGFSTITMQLAGNLWPTEINRQQRGIGGIPRKIREMRVAMDIERHFTKPQILEMYLNQINLGNGAYGVEAASQRYFGKSARDLNIAEAATLAALPKGPERYNPRRSPSLAVERRNYVIDLLRDDGRISAPDAERWKAYPLLLSSRNDYHTLASYFVEYVRQQLAPRFGDDLYRDGLRIYTTLDLDAQLAAERALDEQLDKIESGAMGRYTHETYREFQAQKQSDVSETSTPYLQGAALVMEARTGNILAMVGGRDYTDSKFNRVTMALRQPGSTFKPILYSAAVESGMTFDDMAQDGPISVPMPYGQPDWEPQNYEGSFTDSMLTLREGLWRSLNSIAVRVGLHVGIEPLITEARRFGITTPIDSVPSIFLGSNGVRPIELIAAYSAFANLGPRVVPNAVVRVEDRNGKILYQSEPQSIPVLDPATAWTMNQALQGVVKYGTASDAVWGAGFHVPAGGKTGTTNDFKDVWYIGFTPDIVSGMWLGFDNPQPIKQQAQGGYYVAPAWTQMMSDIYSRRKTPGDWTPPIEMQNPATNGATPDAAPRTEHLPAPALPVPH